ncbi:MAG: hypothetical protein O2960_05495 [Verrucomicrobia bacterium]|nr:hypothetical protein [Verrucomicrobiota bacterium]
MKIERVGLSFRGNRIAAPMRAEAQKLQKVEADNLEKNALEAGLETPIKGNSVEEKQVHREA